MALQSFRAIGEAFPSLIHIWSPCSTYADRYVQPNYVQPNKSVFLIP
jgi:hypothetical protein